ncbi:MAG: transcriptional regulator [Acidimicrobiia bacterium]
MAVVSGRQHIGQRLRTIRKQKGLSLHEVEARSKQEFKASVLGAYERGERAISAARLVRLADIYGVPSTQLLPREVEINLEEREATANNRLTIDLEQLATLRVPEAATITRYAAAIQLQRQDFNGRMLSIRRDDLRVLAAVLGTSAEMLDNQIDDLGLRVNHPVGV